MTMRFREWVREIHAENCSKDLNIQQQDAKKDAWVVEACLDGGIPHMRPADSEDRSNGRWTVICVTDRRGAERVCDLLHASDLIEQAFSNKETMK